MVQHLLIGDLAGLLIALGLTGPILQPLLARRAVRAGCGCSATRSSRCRSGRSTSTSGTSRRSTRACSTSPLLHFAQHACFFTFGLAMWLPLVGPLPKPAWFGDGAMLIYIVVVRLARGGARQRPDLVGHGALSRLRARRGGVGDQPARRPGRRRQPDDDLDRRPSPSALFTWLFFRAANRSAEKQELIELAERARLRARPRPGRARGRRRPGRAPARADPRRQRVSSEQPLPLRARLRGRDREPRRRDRRGAADGAVLRRLDDRLGEHDRGRPGRALDRLLARRPARRPPPETCAASASWCWSRRCCWRWCR